ncbi:MAG TPA: DUF1080 domain-containing protein [Lacunisphaera sp.]
MKILSRVVLFALAATAAFAAVEEAIDSRFKPATADPAVGDWQGAGDSHYVAQVVLDEHGDYQANLLKAFDVADNVVATLRGQSHDGRITLKGSGWSGAIEAGHFKGSKGGESFDLQPVTRKSPTLGAEAPAGAVILFDGKNLNDWANKKGKEWLVEGGPAPWKIVDGVLEVVPGTGGGIITREKFGSCRVHVEFRTLGAPSNSGVFLQTRYEANINETYGKLDGTPNGGFDNCLPKGSEPKIRASRPPLVWQTFDIDFTAPRFDAAGKKTAPATATLWLNGVKLYDHQALELPHGAAGRLGEAAIGPLMLQEHGMPVQFRNIWLLPLKG